MKKSFGKIILAILLVVSVVVIVLAAIHLKDNNKDDKKDVEAHLIELSIDELQEKVDNKETFILVVTQTTCSHCAEYKPVLNEVLIDYDIYGYFIEQDLLKPDELSTLKQIANVSSTPTTVFIFDGEETSTTLRMVGTRSRSAIIEKLKAMKFIE